MLNRIKSVAEYKEIPIVYGDLPKNCKRLYVISPENVRWISIDNSIKDTDEEVLAIAYCLGVVTAIEVLGEDILEKVNTEKETIEKLADLYQLETMRNLAIMEG